MRLSTVLPSIKSCLIRQPFSVACSRGKFCHDEVTNGAWPTIKCHKRRKKVRPNIHTIVECGSGWINSETKVRSSALKPYGRVPLSAHQPKFQLSEPKFIVCQFRRHTHQPKTHPPGRNSLVAMVANPRFGVWLRCLTGDTAIHQLQSEERSAEVDPFHSDATT